MKLQIKSLSRELDEPKKQYLRKRIVWLDEHLPNPAVLTIGVREHITKRSNQAFEVFFHLVMPAVKKPLYIRVFKNTFTEAVDIAEGKLERLVVKKKEKSGKFKFKSIKLPAVKIKLPKLKMPAFKRRGKKNEELAQ
jgi:ribosome-associated translation inhibitor RaiA